MVPTPIPVREAWDSTALNTWMTCPRLYYWTMVEGWQPKREQAPLTFGILIHEVAELYAKAQTKGTPHEQIVFDVVRYLLRASYGKLDPNHTNDNLRTRDVLIRTAIAYMDTKLLNDTLEVVRRPNGEPMVEYSFRLSLPLTAPSGNTYVYCGHIDKGARFTGDLYVVDTKTTRSMGDRYYANYELAIQMGMYNLALQAQFPDEPVLGVIIDACQIAVLNSRFHRGIVTFQPDMLQDMFTQVLHQIKLAEAAHESGHFPANYASCDKYGGCRFREVCNKGPIDRQGWLEQSFEQREPWDPLKNRSV